MEIKLLYEHTKKAAHIRFYCKSRIPKVLLTPFSFIFPVNPNSALEKFSMGAENVLYWIWRTELPSQADRSNWWMKMQVQLFVSCTDK